jgi:hypothetical protein
MSTYIRIPLFLLCFALFAFCTALGTGWHGGFEGSLPFALYCTFADLCGICGMVYAIASE